ncbi:MAG: HEAT repeat domain-containing protein [Cyclobacteriaceae bacterium]|nr:HEAT repeat domain-containing protein [Cyclobacteriaceae bacterium]
MKYSKFFFYSFVSITIWISSCSTPPAEKPLVVREDPAEGVIKAKEARENVSVQIADGLILNLWASDSLAPDPIAMSINDDGAIFLTRTNRQKNSEFDIRGFQEWMTPSIALQTVEDRRAFLRATFAPELSKKNEWLKDLNKDSIHDWHDLAVEEDEVWKLEDQSGDGIADISTRVVHDFNDEINDVAGALLVRKRDMFVGIGPDMWRLQDTNGDGIPDKKESISHGYAVHIGFGGHGMSGAIEGPDGKIYWGIGDIGANITAKDGKKYPYPNEGVIVRSNPDGSDFEVFAAGLRNTHEFVFDEYGNLITSDNDGDHAGESERLAHIVEGADLGWRSNWQYGKYTDPKNNRYNVWMDEGLSEPRWENQAAYIIPPIQNYHNGPTGMVYNPGTALGSAWKNKFFLVEFVGDPTRSHIWSFGLKPKGASFELDGEKDIISGILPTGIRFGPDGALYVADWINGWNTKNYGRVWKIDVTEGTNDLKAERGETKRLMQLEYEDQSAETLLNLLSYADMRIRQKAQFELVTRGSKGEDVFKQALSQRENQLARVHAIWGIGQLAETDKTKAAQLIDVLKDQDLEIVTQAAKVLGDRKYSEAGAQLIPLLSTANPHVKFYAAQALGRMQHKEAVTPLINMIDTNNDEDNYLRHAGVLALSRIGEVDPIVALASSPERDLRIAAVLVLRRLKSDRVAIFLQDKDEYIVAEAARAINDDLSIEKSLPALAGLLKEERFSSEPLLRRSINAALRVGGEKELDLLIAFAKRITVSPALRGEALAALGTWASPSVLDRVDGRYRGKIDRDPALVKSKLNKEVKSFLGEKNVEVLMGTAKMLSDLQLNDFNGELTKLATHHPTAEVRSAMITALHTLKYDQMESIIKAGMNDKDEKVRTTALGLLGDLNISKENLPGIMNPIFEKGSLPEQQQLLRVLAAMDADKTTTILNGLVDQLISKKLSPGIMLELMQAVDSTHSETLINKLAKVNSTNSTLDQYAGTLLGGNRGRGQGYFFWNSAGQCVRCHSIGDQGGKVGPALTTIGTQLTREQLLQALVDPSARLSPGFGMVKLTLKDGQQVTGTLMSETAEELILKTSEAEPLEIAVSRIDKRQNYPSSMPPMGNTMSKSEIRDVIEFLSSLKEK